MRGDMLLIYSIQCPQKKKFILCTLINKAFSNFQYKVKILKLLYKYK